MENLILILIALSSISCLIISILLYLKTRTPQNMEQELAKSISGIQNQIGSLIRDEFSQNRTEYAKASKSNRDELSQALENIRKGLEEKLGQFQKTYSEESKNNRDELSKSLTGFSNSMFNQLNVLSENTTKEFKSFAEQIQKLVASNEEKMDKIKEAVDARLQKIQEDNSTKLDEMRKTVDEKLHATLEKRLGESFQIVSDRLELVHKGLGEMQTLATGVGDLKKVLTNVKTRGVMGEALLESLLEQILAPDQYEKNVCVKQGSQQRVEFAVKFPGQEDSKTPVFLAIDSKFPREDFERLQDSYESGNTTDINLNQKLLETRIKAEAKDINEKYINPPTTCDFAIMFLPIENLFAEVLRTPNLREVLYRDYKVIVCGPTYLAGFLNSLQMGFRTLAIAKRSSEVWTTLGMIKTEFGKFGDLLEATRNKLDAATNSIDTAVRKSRTIERKLRGVEALPVPVGTFLESGETVILEDQDNRLLE